MQKLQRIEWFVLIAMLLMGCAPSAKPATQADAGASKHNNVAEISVISLIPTPAIPANSDECLNCHADKDRLIATADPVPATAASESKGVG